MGRVKYRIAKQTGTTAHFAAVEMEIASAETERRLVKASFDSVRGWGPAILKGVEDGLEQLRARGLAEGPQEVSVLDFVGMPSDTSDADARCASCLAIIKSSIEEDRMPIPHLSEDGRQWDLKWP